MKNENKKLNKITEEKIWEFLESIGYNPQKNQNIIVTYAPENLSAKITSFFTNKFYILQICENEIVLIEFADYSLDKAVYYPTLNKELTLEIPFKSIKSISIDEAMFNYHINIETKEDKIALSTQQKELSSIRSSGALVAPSLSNFNNWHKDNLDETLKNLLKLGN
jgi:hypothetical protein